MKTNHDTWLALAFLAFCGFAAWQITLLPTGVGNRYIMGPSFFPTVLTAAIAVLALALLVRSLVRAGKVQPVKPVNASARISLVAFLVLLGAYALAYERLGFLVSSGLVMVSGMFLLGERRVTHLVLWPGVAVAFAWLMFFKIMKVQLPTFSL